MGGVCDRYSGDWAVFRIGTGVEFQQCNAGKNGEDECVTLAPLAGWLLGSKT